MRFSLALTTASAVFALGALMLPTPKSAGVTASTPKAALSLDDLQGRFEANPDPQAQMHTLSEAAALGTTPALLWVADVAASHPAFEASSAQSLSAVKLPTAAPTLAQISGAFARAPAIRAGALRALATVGTSQQAPLVVGLAFDSREPIEVREEACATLAKLGGVKAVKQLVTVFETESAHAASPSRDRLREAVLHALAEMPFDEAKLARTLLVRDGLTLLEPSHASTVTLALRTAAE